MGSANFAANESGTLTLPTYVKKAWCAVIGGGGKGEHYDGNACSDDGVYGGGGGGAASGLLQYGPDFRYKIGRGGGTYDGNNGEDSWIRDTQNQEVRGGGGRSGGTCSQTGNGGSSSGGGGQGQDGEQWQAFLFAAGRGGGAGKIGGGNAGRGPSIFDYCIEAAFGSFTSGGSGGDGAGMPSGNGSSGQSGGCGESQPYGGNGGDYGGGGGGVAPFSDSSAGGNGGNGAGYMEWITIDGVSKTILRSGESVEVTVSSPSLGTITETVSYVNETSTNIIQKYTKEDSRGNVSEYEFTVLPKVRITSFSADPNPQTSGIDGTPNYNTTLQWEGISVLSATITRNDGALTSTFAEKTQPADPSTQPPNFYSSGSDVVYNLFQSVASGTSQPGSDTTYTITATDGFNTATATLTVKAYNDDCPDALSIPNFLNREPKDVLFTTIGPVSGIDMVTAVNCGPDVAVLYEGSYVTNGKVISGSFLTFRTETLDFNTDENGLINEVTRWVKIGTREGCGYIEFIVQTRAPVVEELFDFGDNKMGYPYPKLDTRIEGEILPDGGTYSSPTQYLTSPTVVETSVSDWEVELERPYGVQIKAKDIESHGPETLEFTDISSQNDTDLEVNVQRQGEQPNNTWTKPNIA